MREAFNLTLNYYNKQEKFSGTANEDWRIHLPQFEILCEEYKTDDSTRIANFAHSLKPSSDGNYLYQKLRMSEVLGTKGPKNSTPDIIAKFGKQKCKKLEEF